jgi:6,7-dimethyl-8-ribityllumazine synthase
MGSKTLKSQFMLNSVIGDKNKFDASRLKIGVVVAQFNSDITEAMLQNLLENAGQYQLKPENFEIVRVPGAVEIPFLLQALADKSDCLVALGCVIRGDTPHFDYVCKYATEGIMRVSLDSRTPVGYGLLTLENHEQSKSRIGGGFGALEAALQSWFGVQRILAER